MSSCFHAVKEMMDKGRSFVCLLYINFDFWLNYFALAIPECILSLFLVFERGKIINICDCICDMENC